MLKELTKEQEAHMAVVRDKFIRLAHDTGPVNKEAVREYIKLVYSYDPGYKGQDIDIVYAESPIEIQLLINEYVRKQAGIPKEKYEMEYFAISYYSDISNYSWVSFYSFFQDIGVFKDDNFSKYLDLFLASNIYQFAKVSLDKCFVCRKPVSIHKDSEDRLHSWDSPAIEWANGDKMYFIKGIEVPDSWVENKKVELDEIEKIDNAELRRIALEIYGLQNYMEDSGAIKVEENEWGSLYRKELSGDEPIVMVSVLNSSPEEGISDDTNPEDKKGLMVRYDFRKTEEAQHGKYYKQYMFRVPPTCNTVLEALAWQADITVDEYLKKLKFES